MLIPAAVVQEDLTKLFQATLYSKQQYYWCAAPHSNFIPKIEEGDGWYSYAIVEGDADNLKILGYLSYSINMYSDKVFDIGIYSFKPGSYTVGRDVYDKLRELVYTHHKVMWGAVASNPANRSYRRFCKKHGGCWVNLIDDVRDADGNYDDFIMYQIINQMPVDLSTYREMQRKH